jgi:hypothetical protein
VKTNYNNLSFFEMCAVVAVVVGVALICFEIFAALPQNQKLAVSDAFAMFDMHEELATSAATIESVHFAVQNYYDQFNIAFVQTFSYPEQIGTPVLKLADALDSYSQNVSYAYVQNNVNNAPNMGQVLGAMFVKESSDAPAAVSLPSLPIHKQYYYHAPSVVQKLLK